MEVLAEPAAQLEMAEGDSMAVPPLPPRYRFRDLIWGDHFLGGDDESDRVRVEFFTNERSLKERLHLYFIKNQRSSLRIRIFNFIIKLLTCILYVIRVTLDDPRGDVCNCLPCKNHTWTDPDTTKELDNAKIHWSVIFFVNRDFGLWITQVVVACISFSETLLITYLSYKGNIVHSILSPLFLLEVLNTVPFIITTLDHQRLRCLFVPVFLNCWLAQHQLENMFGDLNRVFQRTSSLLALRMMKLAATAICLIFTSVCGLQHLQRGGHKHFSLFESLWFVICTFSTVGYGDYTPDIWPSQIFVIVMILVAITVLPLQLEKLGYTLFERNRMGGNYSRHRARTERHVVVCTTALQADTIMDFLNEFYAHLKLQDYYVVLLSPCALTPTMKMILLVPIWAQRVIYIQGSALKDSDLTRCRMQDAEACFILATRNYQDRNAADQHTIMRSWAVKDFAPACPQYVQIYRPENKFHVRYAEHVVCEDEFKYAILANNCLCPAISTLVTLLLHTSRGQEGQSSSEEWQKLYGRCSGNEFYHIRLEQSQFFGEYEGKTFTYASFHAHRKFGVSLVGVKTTTQGSRILINPGPRHLMRHDDICFYMSITKEENSAFILANPNTEKSGGRSTGSLKREGSHKTPQQTTSFSVMSSAEPTMAFAMHSELGVQDNDNGSSRPPAEVMGQITCSGALSHTQESSSSLTVPGQDGGSRLRQKRPSIAPVPENFGGTDMGEIEDDEEEEEEEDKATNTEFVLSNASDCVKEFPPITPYVGSSRCLCHIVRTKRPLCCLQLANACEHCKHRHAREYNWQNRSIIVCSDYASSGLFNFIVPLRMHSRPRASLSPIVLLLESKPDHFFLEAISYFPLVYWMLGSSDSIDDLLRAGIHVADHLVVVNKETSNSLEEEALGDCNTIVNVQTIFRLFPTTNIITELGHSSNMRFMQFRAEDIYSLGLSKIEKKERERGSHISYMFRLPFASGQVFSASMLDTLLYQAFVKDYLINVVRLLLGIDQAEGSGYLTCMTVKREDMWIRTYGRLYQKLCSSTCDIPIGIYRTTTQEAEIDSFATTPDPVGPSEVNFEAFEHPELWKEPPQVSLEVEAMGDHLCKEELQVLKEKRDIIKMVQCRMGVLGLPREDHTPNGDKRSSISYVIINPGYDQRLEVGDIIYLIRPSSLSAKASPLIGDRKRLALAQRTEPQGAETPIKPAPLATTDHPSTSINQTPMSARFSLDPQSEDSSRPTMKEEFRPLLVATSYEQHPPVVVIDSSCA